MFLYLDRFGVSTFQVTVTNDFPFWVDPIPDQTYQIGETLEYFLEPPQYDDINTHQELSFSVSGLPGWMKFNEESQSFYALSTSAVPGTYTITVTLSDGYDSVDDQFDITVN